MQTHRHGPCNSKQIAISESCMEKVFLFILYSSNNGDILSKHRGFPVQLEKQKDVSNIFFAPLIVQENRGVCFKCHRCLTNII